MKPTKAKQKPKMISRSTYLQALGLFTLANRRYLEFRVAEMELVRLLHYPEGEADAGHLSDEAYEDRPQFDLALKREGFVVRQKSSPPSRRGRR